MKNENKTENKTYVYRPENGQYRNAENLFNEISKHDFIDYVRPDGSLLHRITPPGAWKTLGAYNGRANKMLRDGITWSEATKMKITKTSTMRYNGRFNLKINGAELVLSPAENEADRIIITKTGVAGSWGLGSDVAGLIRRASDISKTIKSKDQAEFNNLVLYYVKSEAVAFLENYRITIKATDSIDQARAAMVLEMAKNNDSDYTKLANVEIEYTGLNDFVEWFKANIA